MHQNARSISGPRRLAACLGAALAALTLGALARAEVGAPRQAEPALTGNRAPQALLFSPDGRRVYVTEADEGAVAVLDAGSMKVVDHLPTGGRRPAGLALLPDGKTLVVANSYSGSIGVVDLAGKSVKATIPLPGLPWEIAVAPDGKRAFVSVSQLDQVAVLDLASLKVVKRIGVGHRPQALRLSPDAETLAVANTAGGSVSVVNLVTLKEDARVKLKGVNVRGLAMTEDGGEVYTTLMPAFNTKPANDPAELWHNLVQAVKLEGSGSAVGEDQWLDFARLPGAPGLVGTPDQYDIVLDKEARFAWTAVGGRDVVTRITIHDRRRDAIWPISQVEAPVGANPRGLALSPDGKRLWVTNHLGNSVSVVDAQAMKTLATLDLGKATRIDPTLPGQYLFNNAGLTRTHRFTCASCHPQGASDGLAWNFVHVPDSFTRRNSRDLRLGVGDTAPFRWSGHDAHLSDFINEEVTGLLGSPKPSAEQTAALASAVAAFQMPPNPYRDAAGAFTPLAKQGEALFEGRAGCAGCHRGPARQAWIGTTREGLTVDVPQLAGAYDGAPYLHDGRAARLEDIFSRFNEQKLHGRAHTLSTDELAAVLRYVREL